MKKYNGFTLIELMITLTVLGILLMSVVGFAGTYVSNAKLRSITDEFRTGLMTAKIEAIKRNSKIDFTATSNGSWSIAIPAAYTESGDIQSLQHKDIDGNSLYVVGKDVDNVSVSVISFTGSGRPTVSKNVTFSVTIPNKTCGVDITCLNVLVTTGGQIKVIKPV